jgi:hypothetical protein
MMTFPIDGSQKKHVPNHQPAPVMFRYGTPLRMIFVGAKMCIRL